MNGFIHWIQNNLMKSVLLIILISFLIPLFIVQAAFKLPAISPFFEAEWTAGDFITFWASFLSFLGTISLGGLALYQNTRLNNINNELTQHQYKPVITVNHFVGMTTEKEKLRTYYRLVKRNASDIIINYGWTQEPLGFQNANLSFKNIGLGPAICVELYWFELTKVTGLSSLDQVYNVHIEDFYDKVEYSNFTYIEDGSIKNEPWQIFTEFDMGISEESNRLNMFITIDNNVKKLHSIIEIRYQNVIGKKFKKLLYVGFNDGKTGMLPVSKEYYISN